MGSWIVAATVAGALAGLGPVVLARLPEPEAAAADKPPYAMLASRPRLGWWLAAVAAIAAGLLGSAIEPVALLPAWIVLASVGVLLAYIDWHTKLLPRLIVLPLNALLVLLVALAALVERDATLLIRGLVCGSVVFAVFWLSNFVYAKGLGYGDVRLSFGLAVALGALGSSQALVGLYAGFAIGALGALLLMRLRVLATGEFAFGPYLLIGALVGACWGPAIMSLL